MKTLITRAALLLAAAFTFANVRAAGPVAPAYPMPALSTSMERELDHQLNKYVTYPLLERERNMDGEVYVTFVINTEGKIEIISAHSDNTDLCEYVLNKLSRIDIGSNPGGLWKTEHVRFVFHPEA